MTFAHMQAAPAAPTGFPPADAGCCLIESPRPCESVGSRRGGQRWSLADAASIEGRGEAGLGSSLDFPYAGNSDPVFCVNSGLWSY